VVGKLPNAVSLSCRSLLLSINFEDKDAYERLKDHLCRNYSKSKWQQGYSLLDHPGLSDRRPSQLLQDMRALLPDKEAEVVLFQCLFLKRLSTSMSDAVMAAGLENIEDMAAMADRLHDKPAAAGVSAVALLFTRFGYRQQAEEVQPLRPLSEPLWPLARPPCSHARTGKREEGLLLLQHRRATSESVGERSRQDLVPVPSVLRRRGSDVPPRLHQPGKLGSRRGVNSLGGLTYLTDSLSRTRFLVDTGAAVSVLPYTGAQSTSSAADGPSLAGADGTSIKSWGKIYKSVSFGGRHFADVPHQGDADCGSTSVWPNTLSLRLIYISAIFGKYINIFRHI
jgi:hypothetical protein